MKGAVAGFTLLELLVAIAIFAIMAVMAYGGLDSVLNQRRGVEQRLDRIAQLQKAYMRLRADFQQVRNRPVRDPYGDEAPALFVTPSAPVLEFTRGGWRNPLFQPRASEERISYRLSDGKLLRTSWRVLDRVQASVPVEVTVLDRVDEVGWRFIDPTGEWQPNWPPLAQAGQTGAPPPSALELTLRTRDWGELRFLFRTGLDNVAASAFGNNCIPIGNGDNCQVQR
jgi:general secretion pathway protein J